MLLHPVGLDLTFFDSLVAELSPHFQVLRVDMRGHGATPPDYQDSEPYLEEFAEDVHALLRRLEFTPTAVIGFSFGGMIAQELALNHPQDLSALIVGACPCTFNSETRAALLQRGESAERNGMASILETTMCRWFSATFRARGGDAPAQRRLLDNDIKSWRDAWHAISWLHTAPRLSTIKMPTLCMAAEEDISAPPPVVETIAKAIHNARFVVVPDTPHMLFIEAPGAVAAVIIPFLKSLPCNNSLKAREN